MKERIKKFNYKRLILPLIVILSEVFLYFQMMDLQPKLTAKYQWMFLAVCICANIACLVILWLLKKFDKMKIQTVFLTIAGIYGGLYMVFVPALLGTDELPHFLRPYQISVGDVIVKHPEKNETMIPKNIGEFVGEDKMADRYTDKYLLHESSYDDTVNLWNGDVTSIDYSPIPYLPQVIGFWIARLFHLSPLFTMYMVRFCNFMTWLGLGYLAFKILPVKKIFALILYTSPAVLSLVSTCSGDAFALGLFFVFIAYILQFIYNKREVKKKDIVLLTLISLGFSTYKVFYVPYVLFLFLIPKSCFKDSLKRKVGTILPIIFGAFLLDFLWFMASAVSQVSSGLVSEQIEYILMNPFQPFAFCAIPIPAQYGNFIRRQSVITIAGHLALISQCDFIFIRFGGFLLVFRNGKCTVYAATHETPVIETTIFQITHVFHIDKLQRVNTLRDPFRHINV